MYTKQCASEAIISQATKYFKDFFMWWDFDSKILLSLLKLRRALCIITQ